MTKRYIILILIFLKMTNYNNYLFDDDRRGKLLLFT